MKQILNDALNKALITDKIKGVPNSNKISDFVNKYYKQMKTPYLDRQIDLLEIHERLEELTDDGKAILIEYKAIKKLLN